jgi:hypothetical protein
MDSRGPAIHFSFPWCLGGSEYIFNKYKKEWINIGVNKWKNGFIIN